MRLREARCYFANIAFDFLKDQEAQGVFRIAPSRTMTMKRD
jgi:hypothetical protein